MMKMLNILKLMRLQLVFTAMADSFAGYILSTSGEFGYLGYPIGLMGISGLLYSFGMVLNDLVDVEKDRSIYPTRVLPQGKLSKKSAGLLSIALVVGALTLAFLLRRETLIMTVIIVLLIFIYNVFGKNIKGVGAVNIGVIRFCNFGLGGTLNLGYALIDSGLLIYPFLLLLYVASFTFTKSLEEGESKKELFLFLVLFMIISILGINGFARPNSASESLVPGITLSILMSVVLIFGGINTIGGFSRAGGTQFCSQSWVTDRFINLAVLGIIPFDATILLSNDFFSSGLVVLLFLVPSIMLNARLSED